jgi:ribosome-binding factor A
MKFRELRRQRSDAVCAEIDSEDGTDPRFDVRDESRKVSNRKALQLCGQVARTLNCVLAGECSDELLRDLIVESVVPAPSSARLLVTLTPSVSATNVDFAMAMGRVQRAAGRFRAEIAAEICRKNVPELTFRVVQSRK